MKEPGATAAPPCSFTNTLGCFWMLLIHSPSSLLKAQQHKKKVLTNKLYVSSTAFDPSWLCFKGCCADLVPFTASFMALLYLYRNLLYNAPSAWNLVHEFLWDFKISASSVWFFSFCAINCTKLLDVAKMMQIKAHICKLILHHLFFVICQKVQ